MAAKPVGVKHGMNLLTDAAVWAFKGPGRLNDGAGLSLAATRTGYRRWIFRYSFGGKARELYLGPSPAVSLKQARARRDKAKAILADGMDPAESLSAKARKQQEAVADGIPTFSSYSETFLNELSPQLKDKKARAPWELALRVYAKPLHDLRLNAITSTDVAAVLRPICHTKRETARRLRWRLEAVFAAAIVAGFREQDGKGQPIRQRNPAAWKDNLAELAGFKAASRKPVAKHHAAMPWRDVPAFLSQLRGMEALSARALELAILTACRTGEAIGARWDDIDLGSKVWTIPASRMKAGREHVVPLSKPALESLAAIPRLEASPFVFPGATAKKHLSNMALLMLLRRMECPFTAHGFRSSFRDWAAECTQFPREIAELALAHQVGTATERAYSRSTLLEKRRALMDHWAVFCEGATGGNIVALSAKSVTRS